MAFFTSESDSTLNDAFILADADVFISKIEAEYTAAVESESGNDITLTTSGTTYGTDTYNSTVGLNLIVTADSSKLFIGKVKDTTNTTIVFDATAMTNIADGTAGTASDWTAASAYNFYVMTADSTYAWGAYFGHVKDLEVSMEQNNIQFTKGVPQEEIVEDLLSMKYSVKGKNFQPANEDVWKAIMNSTQYGSQISQWEHHGGFVHGARPFYRLTLIGKTRGNKDITLQFFRGQFTIDGALALSTEEYKPLGFTYNVKKDALRGDAYNTYMIRVDE